MLATGERVYAAHSECGAGAASVHNLHVPKDACFGTGSKLTPDDGKCRDMFATRFVIMIESRRGERLLCSLTQLATTAGTATWRTTDPVMAVFPRLLVDHAAEAVLRRLWKRELDRITEGTTQSTLHDLFKHIVLCVWQASTSSLAQQTAFDRTGGCWCNVLPA